ncbi:MAG: BREX system P-loop protein BrxC, partial [Candidatus Enteromonas sp.]
WLAEMERGLDKDGLFQKFIAHFNEISGKDYLAQRKNIFFLRDKFIQALSDIKGISLESARDFFDDAQKHFSLNTEQFANIIAEYCEKTGKHVIFLMDEVGQFIGSNSEMMLGLQTVVEDLGKQANGKAWVVVTSQQQIDALIEGTNHAAQMDFSKITGRFKTRLTMSSQNADEVIQKRLLEKTEDAANVLGTLYDEKADKLNNLLAFPANPKWTGYKDKEEFIKDYPFVNYQFELLQQVFDAIRDNGMSEGKSISSGERSLLSAFKDSAEAKCNQNIGILIPFNDFYKTADEFMDWNVKQVFARAARRMPDAFDIEVLKVLFMLKNVKEMEPTIERIATLMVSSIDEDKVSLKKKIKDSLDRLIAETFVQQNGDRYEFLTDEEQEANRKIKNSSYSQGDVYNKIRDIVYENILETGRNFSYNKYSFTLNRFIDENLIGTENSDGISVKIYTPWDRGENSFEQRSLSTDGCLIIDLTKGTYLDELIQCARIDTFEQNNSAMATSSMIAILQKKNAEHTEREKRAEDILRECLKNADYYQNGTKLDLASTDPKKRFALGMEKAILNKFHALNYVVNFAGRTDDISTALRDSQAESLVDPVESDANSKALNEILRYVSDERRWSRQVS